MKVRKLNIVKTSLHGLIKNTWILEDNSFSHACHILLPVKEIDLMINLSGRINHSAIDSVIEKGQMFCNVIRNTTYEISHKGELAVLGISFNSYSLPVLSELSPMKIRDRFYELRSKNSEYKDDLELMLKLISEEIKDNWIPQKRIMNIVRYFDYDCGLSRLEDLCNKLGISCRTAERIFATYVQMPPKKYLRLLRFRNSLNKMFSNRNKNLTDVAYDCSYYDQSHFCEEFKHYTGISPASFLKRKVSVTQNIEFM